MSKKHYTLQGFPVMYSGNRWFEYFKPNYWYRAIKYFVQRGWRGYADCDHWDADAYLSAVIYGVIKDLKSNLMGYPQGLTEDQWSNILQEILDGLDAKHELEAETTIPDSVYGPLDDPDFLTFTDTGRGDGSATCTFKHEFNQAEYDKWAEPLRKKEKRATLLLVKHWPSLWN